MSNERDYRDMIIELCAVRAEQAPLPSYGTNARHTGREEARQKIAAYIRKLKGFHGAECPSYPACDGGCGIGCTKEFECRASVGGQSK